MTEFLVEHAWSVAVGATAILAIAVVGAFAKQPIERQRTAELSVLATLVWIPLAFVPMPRFLRSEVDVAAPIAAIETEPLVFAPIGGVLRIDPYPGRAVDVVPSVVPAPAPTPVDWAAVGAFAFVCGSFACGAWLLVGAWQLRRIVGGAALAPTDVLRHVPLDVRERARMLVTDRRSRPFCCGLFRPTIVIPRDLVSDPALAAVLRHEAAHLRQRDPWSHLLFAVALPVLYIHPLFWFARHRARIAAEMIADDQATRSSSKTDYARQMIDLAQRDSTRAPLAAVPIFRRPSDFTRRIEMLLQRNEPLSARSTRMRRATRWVSTAALLTTVVGLCGATMPAQEAVQDPVDTNRALLDKIAKLEWKIESLTKQLAEKSNRADPRDDLPMLRQLPIVGDLFLTDVVVERGDTIASILRAQRVPVDGGTIEKLLAANPQIRDAKRLKVGQKVRIPLSLKAARPEVVDPANIAATSVDPLLEMSVGTPRDVLQLVNAIIEAEGRVEMTRARLVSAAKREIPVVDAEVRMNERKLTVLMRVARMELDSLAARMQQAHEELEQTRKLAEKGFASKQEVARKHMACSRIRTSIELLRSVFVEAPASDKKD